MKKKMDETFTFANTTPLLSSAENWYIANLGCQPTAHKETWQEDCVKIEKTCPESSSSNLPQAPPSWRWPPFTPLLACRMASGRGDLLHASDVSPSSVSCPLHPHSSHLVPPVHKNRSLEVGDVHPLLQLPVQGIRVEACGPHPVGHVLPALVMVKRVEPENRPLFISGFEQVFMLATSCKSIPPSLTLVCGHFQSTFLAPQIITNKDSRLMKS